MKLTQKKTLLCLVLIVLSLFTVSFITQAKSIRDLKYAVVIPEEILDNQVPDPAAETEIMKQLIDNGFKVIDQHYIEELRYTRDVREALQNTAKAADLGKELGVDVLIIGEAIAEETGQGNGLVNYRARLEVKAVEVDTGRVLYTHGVHAPADDISNELAAKSAFKSAATGWVVDFIPMEPPEEYGVLMPNFDYADEVDQEMFSDMVADNLTKEIQRRLLESKVADKIAILSSGEERAEVYQKIQRGDFNLPSLLLQGKVNQFAIEKLDELDGFLATKYKLVFKSDMSWQIVDQTGNRVVMGSEGGSIEFEAGYAGFDNAPAYEEMGDDNKMKQAINYTIEQIVEDIKTAVAKQIKKDKKRYKESALANKFDGGVASASNKSKLKFVFKTETGDRFKGHILEELKFDSDIMKLDIAADDLEKVSKAEGKNEWSLKTMNGNKYSGNLIMEKIKVEVNNNQVSLEVEDLKEIFRIKNN